MESQRKANPKQVENIDSTLITASILVAEDNLVNQILIKKFLKKWHIGKLVIASDGQEAVEEFEKSDFDVVLLDIQMPELDGFSVAKMIRENKFSRNQDVPILVLSASTYQEIKSDMDKHGINDFIEKPFTPEDLYIKIAAYLSPKDRN